MLEFSREHENEDDFSTSEFSINLNSEEEGGSQGGLLVLENPGVSQSILLL
jgi:hypothetical protein